MAVSLMMLRDTGPWLPLIGVPQMLAGFGGALAITTYMGWGQAFGEAQKLTTTGAFKYSRNPVYVCTWLGLAGWALCLPAPTILAPIGLWAALYLIAPRLEEPWLERHFGQTYTDYKNRTPRFFGL